MDQLGRHALSRTLLDYPASYADAREQRRRRAGLPPRWPARLPILYARQLERDVDRSLNNRLEIPGTLTCTPAAWVWTPVNARFGHGVEPFTLDRADWRATVHRIPSPWNQGLLTLTGHAGHESISGYADPTI